MEQKEKLKMVEASEVGTDDFTGSINAVTGDADRTETLSLDSAKFSEVNEIKENPENEDEKDIENTKEPESDTPEEDSEEIAFAGAQFSKINSDSKRQPVEKSVEETESSAVADDNDGGDEVVFAAAPLTSRKKTTIPTASSAVKKSRRRPFVAVGITLALVAACGVGAAFIINSANGSKEPVKTAAQPSETSHLSAPDSDASYVVTDINTGSITFGKGVTVEGVKLEGKTLSQAYDAMADTVDKLRGDVEIIVSCEGDRLVLTEKDFDYDSNVADVLLQAYHFSRGELTAASIETSSENGVTNFKVTTAIDPDSVDSVVKKTAKEFDIQPQDARVTKFDPEATEKFTYADGNDGYLIDQEQLKENIRSIISQKDKQGSLSIKRIRTPYKIKLAQVKANTKLIASHATTVNNRYESNENMKLAIRAASGTEVKAGETFSFNAMTGDTTTGDMHYYANGTEGSYMKSTAIVKGEHVDQYGGGICQASTTIYTCAMKAGMEAIERHAHQFPSFYSPFGLDATVDYGNLDMRFKNNTDYSVFIATYVYDSNGDGMEELNVEMYGPVPTEYDEIVPIGWVTWAGPETYSAMGAQVYFKDGKEIKRVMLPEGAYDYYADGFYNVTSQGYAESLVASDPVNGPSADPTMSPPTIYSPYGCGSSEPIAYGTGSEYLKQAGALS